MRNTIGFSKWIGIAAAAAGIFAPRVLGWCPSPSDYVIKCQSCTVLLTCDAVGVPIWITGFGVTLDGQNHYVEYHQGAAIRTFNIDTEIKNLAVIDAGISTSSGGYGISIEQAGTYLNQNTLSNVRVIYSKSHGIYNSSNSNLTIRNSYVGSSGGDGVLGSSPTGAWTSIYNTTSERNVFHGFATNSPNSTASYNTFSDNGSYGYYAYGVGGLSIYGNTLQRNYRGLFLSSTIAPSVQNNTGSQNTVMDCFDVGSTLGSHSGNSWGTANGPNCIH